MKNSLLTIITALVLTAPAVQADTKGAPKAPLTFGVKGYVWNQQTAEQVEALSKTGDMDRGRETYRLCRGCHKPDGSGRPDGTYPRLTGQHATVIIKQVTDVRAGLRFNPKMDPFTDVHAVTVQEIVDIAVYLNATRTVVENGKGPGDATARGEALYQKDECAKCHGRNGEGNAEKFYPAIAAQHYKYLLRELEFIQAGTRGNSHPDMVKAVSNYSYADLVALSDYLSRLPDYRSAGGGAQGGKK